MTIKKNPKKVYLTGIFEMGKWAFLHHYHNTWLSLTGVQWGVRCPGGGALDHLPPSLPGAFSFSAVPRAHSTSTQNVPLVLESACYSTTATPAAAFRPPRHDPGLVCADSPREREARRQSQHARAVPVMTLRERPRALLYKATSAAFSSALKAAPF